MPQKMLAPLEIAEITHEANRIYCRYVQSFSALKWQRLSVAGRQSIADGVEFVINNPACTAPEIHAEWVKSKIKEGWTDGGVLDHEAKVHPNLKPWDDLPEREQMKDELFLGIVKACLGPLRTALGIPNTPESPPSPSDGQGPSHGGGDVPNGESASTSKSDPRRSGSGGAK